MLLEVVDSILASPAKNPCDLEKCLVSDCLGFISVVELNISLCWLFLFNVFQVLRNRDGLLVHSVQNFTRQLSN